MGSGSVILYALLAGVLAACGGASATPAATATPPSTSPTPTPLPVVPFSGVVPAGTYAWTSFEPKLTLVIPDGWQVGHRGNDYFDLFPVDASGGGPGVGFGRFAGVYGAGGPVPLASAAGVVDTLAGNPALDVERLGATELLGLHGQGVRISVDAPATRLFDEAQAPFQFDPGWTAQCWILDVDGAVLVVGVFGKTPDAAADLAGAQPLLDGVSLAR